MRIKTKAGEIMLNIKDINLLKITKVKPWTIYFNYNNTKYLLHGATEDYESSVALYERKWNGKKYDLEYISGYLSCSDNVENEFITYVGKGKIYSQIDKKRFVSLLEYKGLCKGCFALQVGKNKSLINKNNIKISKLEDEIRLLRNKK